MKSFNEIYPLVYKNCKQKQIETTRFRSLLFKTLKLIILLGLIFLAYKLIKNIEYIFPTMDNLSFYLLTVFTTCALTGVLYVIYLIGSTNKSKRYKNNSSFQELYKTEVLGRLVEYYDPNLRFALHGRLPDYCYQVRSFGEYTKISYSDSILGKIDGKLPLYMSDIIVEKEAEKTEQGDIELHPLKKQLVDFQGLYAAIPMQVPRRSVIRLIPNGVKYIEKYDDCENLKLDSIELENNFECFASDRMYAIKLLTSEVIECIVAYKKRIKDPIDIVLAGNFLSIRIRSGDTFEGVEYKNVLDYDLLYKYYNYLDFVCHLAIVMNANVKRYMELYEEKPKTKKADSE